MVGEAGEDRENFINLETEFVAINKRKFVKTNKRNAMNKFSLFVNSAR